MDAAADYVDWQEGEEEEGAEVAVEEEKGKNQEGLEEVEEGALAQGKYQSCLEEGAELASIEEEYEVEWLEEMVELEVTQLKHHMEGLTEVMVAADGSDYEGLAEVVAANGEGPSTMSTWETAAHRETVRTHQSRDSMGAGARAFSST